LSARLAIYGASGYTGRLLAAAASASRLDAVLVGRSRERLSGVSEQTGFPLRIAETADAPALRAAFSDCAVVVNSAGPFPLTAKPVLEACLSAGAHYLDVAGEGPVFGELHRYEEAAKQARVLIMPGAGFVVAAGDALAAHVVQRLPHTRSLWLGFSRSDPISRGSFASMLDLTDGYATIRRNSRLLALPAGSLTHAFDFGSGASEAMLAPWPDPFTAYLTTGIPEIEAYLEADPASRWAYRAVSAFAPALRFPAARRAAELLAQYAPDGPTEAEREATPKVVVAEAEDVYRQRVVARLFTPNVYTFTAHCVTALAERALKGDVKPGYWTPAGLYGPDFVLSLPGVRREDAAPV
jgi:short subunit dehydrogenase-like uncharacterized protein